jgi:hypothetical protein
MVPALTALRLTAAAPTRRFGVVYVPNGIAMDSWIPATDGAQYELTPILQPLTGFREQFLVVSGLDNKNMPGERTSAHPRGCTKFLTNAPPKAATGASDVQADVSIDQIMARAVGSQTQLASLELGLESTESAASCEAGFNCAYTSTISWRGPVTPLPVENNPRTVFERLFGDSGSTDPAAQRARMQQQQSLLDSVRQSVDRFQRGLGAGDRSKLEEYLDAVRDIERRIQAAEGHALTALPRVEQPISIPPVFEDHAKLMFDLQVLAYQTDLTRIITFMIGRELTGRQYPEIGVPDAHHPISHHASDRQKIAKLAKINTFHATLFAHYLEKLRATPDGDGSLLDHLTILYGAGLSDSNSHSPLNLPILLVGGGGTFKGGRHLRFPAATPMANLNLTLLENFGVRQESIGDSTGPLSLL